MTITIRLRGQRRPQPRSFLAGFLAGAALGALALPFALDAAEAKPKATAKPPAVTAKAMPLPRPSPLRTGSATAQTTSTGTGATSGKAAAAGSGATSGKAAAAGTGDDAIGSLIANDFAGESNASEDSDLPEASVPDVDVATTPPPMPPAKGVDTGKLVGLKLALNLLENNDPGAATLAAYALPDRVDIKIVNWLIACDGYAGVPSSSLLTLQKSLADWPSQTLMRIRYEQALVREQPQPAVVIKALGGKVVSDDGKILLGKALLASGQKDDAAALVRPFWRDGNFAESTEKRILAAFSDILRPADHKARMDRLFYAERASDGLRAASLLDKNEQALAKAVVLVIKGSSKAGKALDALPAAVKREPLYTFSRIQVLRRSEHFTEAGQMLASAPRDPAALVSPDAWWVERRLVSRALIEQGNPQLAYTIAANHSAESATLQAEAEFHAGWYALEYLHDPAKAKVHFANIAKLSTLPLSVSRAQYWLGRAYDTGGDANTAKFHFQLAAAYPTTFYGQLAVSRLGVNRLGITQPPAPTATTRATFEARELVQAIRHLTAVGYADRAAVIYRQLAETLNDPAEIWLLADLAEKNGYHQIALQVGKSAALRLPVGMLAFPTAAIPPSAQTPNIERPVVFAIARQESAFNPGAISSAGARGLLQLMPATAKQVAKDVGLPYSKARLTSDPGYNATLGAAHLGDLVDNFGGSYVMTFAAYNAGASRVSQWVRDHGDPRDPRVDVVNWIELIPFTETRNYVQRIMENLQVYRAQLGSPTLNIEADLRRGGQH